MKKLRLQLTFLIALLSCAKLPAMFTDARSDWYIQAPTQKNAVEEYALEELNNSLEKVFGQKLPVRYGDDLAPRKSIVLGSMQSSEEVRRQASRLKLKQGTIEELAVFSLDGKLYLAGNQPRGVLYAVYWFLQNELDCRWFWPGKDGEFIKTRKNYEPGKLAIHEKPAFRFREMTPCWLHFHIPTETWLARNFLNGGSRTPEIRDKAGFHRIGGGHQVSVSQKLFDQHPDWFSLINGKRDINGYAGCWANPEFTQYVVENLITYVRKYNIEILNTFPADIVPRCQCQACQDISEDPSARWFIYYKQLIDEIHKEIPQLMFAGIAYQEYRKVPSVPVQGLEYVEHCQYSRCYTHPFGTPDCSLNEKTMTELENWQKVAPMGIYGYEFDAFTPQMYQPCWNMLADEAKVYRDMKLVRMKTELSVRYPKDAARADIPQQQHRLPNYIYAKLIWNPDLNVEALIQDWCEKLHGPAAGEMLAYHLDMAKAWDGMTSHLSYFGAKPDGSARMLLDEELIKRCHTYFAEAFRKIADTDENSRFKEETKLEQELFQRWEKLYYLSKENAQTACLSLLEPAADVFAKLPVLPMRAEKEEFLPAQTRMYWSLEALHIQVSCQQPDMSSFKKGQPGRDAKLWSDDMIEVFLDFNDGSTYRHFAFNAAGGSYDAHGNDSTWQPEWQHKVTLLDDGWIAEMQLPFSSLERQPKVGEQWRIVVIRNSKPAASGYPIPAYHDMNGAANIYFSGKANPEYRLSWISRPRKDEKTRYENLQSTLLSNGWQSQHALGPKAAEKMDFSDSNLIVIENYQNRFSQRFFDEKLIPAVKAGAIVLYNCYFWVHELQQQYSDPSFEMKFVEKVNSIRKPVSITEAGQFSSRPHDLRKVLNTTPSGYFAPVFPEKWEVLATQYDQDNVEQPFLLGRPLGKGYVVLSGDFYGQVKLFDNIMHYLWRKEQKTE